MYIIDNIYHLSLHPSTQYIFIYKNISFLLKTAAPVRLFGNHILPASTATSQLFPAHPSLPPGHRDSTAPKVNQSLPGIFHIRTDNEKECLRI